MSKAIIVLFFSFLCINQTFFSVFDREYAENLFNLSIKKQFSALLHARYKEISFYINDQKIIMGIQNSELRYKNNFYDQLLKADIYLFTIKDRDKTKFFSFGVAD